MPPILRNNIHILAIILALIFVQSSFAQKEWTIMVYLNADNDLENAGIIDINEMEFIGSSSDIDIVVQIDRNPENDTLGNDWAATRRYYITKDMDIQTDGINSQLIEDLGELNMGDPQVLYDFVSWAMNNYPANKYMLVLWDHGDGWTKKTNSGSFHDAIPFIDNHKQLFETNSEINPTFITPSEDKLPDILFPDGDFKFVGVDETNDDELYNYEILSVLENVGHIDILGFDACLMGMLEVAYEFRNEASYAVFSEETEPYDGWPYDSILGQLELNPTMSASELSSEIVSQYANYFDTEAGEFQTLSAVDLSLVDNIATNLDIFCNEVISNGDWGEVRTYLSQAEQFGYPKAAYAYYDLYHIAELAEANLTGGNISTAAAELKLSIQNSVLANWSEAVHPNANGLSIYFPQYSRDFNNWYLQGRADFGLETNWYLFLSYYWGNGVPIIDIYEPNDVYSQSGFPLKPGFAYESYINSIDDMDYWMINSGKQEQITIDLEVPGNADFDMLLLDSTCENAVAMSAESGNGVNEHIEYLSPGAEWLYLLIAPDNSFSANPYSININQSGNEQGRYILSFDDGTPDGGTYCDVLGDAIGSVFELQSYPMKLDKVWINFTDLDAAQTGGNGSFYFLLVDNYGEMIDPLSLGALAPSATGWNYLDLSAWDITINTPFFIGLLYDGTNTPAVAYDAIDGFDDFYYDGTNDEWTWLDRSFFIRLDISFLQSPLAIEDEFQDRLPTAFKVSQNYPNPFNPATTIEYTVPTRSYVTIEIFNLLGQKVRTLIDETKPAGSYEAIWNGTDDNGKPAASGVYLYRYRAGDIDITKKMILLK